VIPKLILEKLRVEVALQPDGGRRAKQLVEKDDDNTKKNEESSVGNWMQSMDASPSRTSFGYGEEKITTSTTR